jgi:hypothetical protein
MNVPACCEGTTAGTSSRSFPQNFPLGSEVGKRKSGDLQRIPVLT